MLVVDTVGLITLPTGEKCHGAILTGERAEVGALYRFWGGPVEVGPSPLLKAVDARLESVTLVGQDFLYRNCLISRCSAPIPNAPEWSWYSKDYHDGESWSCGYGSMLGCLDEIDEMFETLEGAQ